MEALHVNRPRRGSFVAIAASIVAAGICAAGVNAATASLTLTNCSATNTGYRFVINGAGFVAGTSLDIRIADVGKADGALHILGQGAPDSGFTFYDAALNPDGTFSVGYDRVGTSESLPATLTLSSYDGTTGEDGGVALGPVVVDASTPCADGSSLSPVAPPPTGPKTKDDCKKDEYKQWTTPAFRNQGQCVSYVEHLAKPKKQ